MLWIYNTLTRNKQTFVPIEPGRVRMYVCGMTVYDYCHLGHGRVLVVFDMVTRWLRASGFDVTYVRNITDIDDKIIRRAQENGESIGALTERFIGAMNEDASALGVLPPDHEPRATRYVDAMQDMIRALHDKGIAYVADNEDVCYAVRKFPGYGKLSGKSLEDLRAGERVEVATGKHDPLDFVLWKHAKDEEPDEVKWGSPWGRGRPGWHIECSAMSTEFLGPHFDIHGGGQDLQFPHHENEIAQSEGAHGATFVNYWMHNGFVRVDDEKMSKSLGNFFTIREVLRKYDAEVVRFFILRAHYRSPLNYSDAHLEDAKHALTGLYIALKGTPAHSAKVDWDDSFAISFREAMNDDFNTPEAIAVLHKLAGELNRTNEAIDSKNWRSEMERQALVGEAERLGQQLRGLGGILGLLERDSLIYLQGTPAVSKAGAGNMDNDAIAGLIEARNAARRAKNYAEADRIRADLLAAGILLEDTPQGTTWRRA